METNCVAKAGLKEKVARQKCEVIMQGRLLSLPGSVAYAIEDSEFRVEARDGARLAWSLVDGWTEPKYGQSFWKQINDMHFLGLGNSSKTKTKVKKWLIDQGFVSLKMEMLADGRQVPHKRFKKESQKYRVPTMLRNEPRMSVSLEQKNKSISVLLKSQTDECLYCEVTRQNLGYLELQEDRLYDYCLDGWQKTLESSRKDDDSDRENRRFRAIESIFRNTGSVKRGTNVNRLYSPWAIAPKETRPLFKFCGSDMVEFDLQASQPTLIADFCGDNDFLEACYSDELYMQVAEILGVDRKKAKKKFLAYCYGNVRTPKSKNKEAWAIQEFVEEKFPVAGDYIRSQKRGDYRKLNRKLQNREAGIFLDVIFAELIRREILALTVHDCVYCRQEDANQVEEIMESALSQNLRKHKLNKSENKLELSTKPKRAKPSGEYVLSYLADENTGLLV